MSYLWQADISLVDVASEVDGQVFVEALHNAIDTALQKCNKNLFSQLHTRVVHVQASHVDTSRVMIVECLNLILSTCVQLEVLDNDTLFKDAMPYLVESVAYLHDNPKATSSEVIQHLVTVFNVPKSIWRKKILVLNHKLDQLLHDSEVFGRLKEEIPNLPNVPASKLTIKGLMRYLKVFSRIIQISLKIR